MSKYIIIEDEEPAFNRLKKMIGEIDSQLVFLENLGSVKSSVEWFQNNPQPDLIFMDIQLSDGNSFEIFKQVKVTCPIIFITAFDQFALEAFKVNSVDYILKPIKKEELSASIEKFNSRKIVQNVDFTQLLQMMQQPKTQYKERFAVKFGEHLRTIETNDIAYFYTENRVNFFVTFDTKRYVNDFNLDELEALLPPKQFFRINRQFIISIKSIAEMLTYSKSRVLVKLNPPSKLESLVSTERSSEFKGWLAGE
jgi:two-component system, LytTR family, response regulator LytT